MDLKTEFLSRNFSPKTNERICFLGEVLAWQFWFEIYWPLRGDNFRGSSRFGKEFRIFLVIRLKCNFAKVLSPLWLLPCYSTAVPSDHPFNITDENFPQLAYSTWKPRYHFCPYFYTDIHDTEELYYGFALQLDVERQMNLSFMQAHLKHLT